MLFNSIDFAIFLPIVFILYWFVTSYHLKLQNCLIVVASYIFYGWWDWRFLSLVLFSTTLDFFVGIGFSKIEKESSRKLLLWTSVAVNLGFLGFFKYYNFFLDNFIAAFTFFGQDIHVHSLNIILPVGISFYTFQSLSYGIDVYHRRLEPTKDFLTFAAFVSFFPQLVAGPIERATHLLPQFYTKRVFDYAKAVDGMRQILWGLFKKIVIADNCAEYANIMFDDPASHSGSSLALGALLFTFQIYGDFSGYSDIALGTARLFGFDLMRNFNFPYFSRDIAEFWRRWHISLSTWFRDYLYIPLGGSHGNTWFRIRNTFIIFLVSGFWHGANWTYIIWGALNAVYFLPLLLTKQNRSHLNTIAEGRIFPTAKEFAGMALTFSMVVFAWIFFRASSVKQAFVYIANMFSSSMFSVPEELPITTLIFLSIFIMIEWLGRTEQYALASVGLNWKRPLRLLLYYSIVISLFWFGGNEQQFIYFQF